MSRTETRLSRVGLRAPTRVRVLPGLVAVLVGTGSGHAAAGEIAASEIANKPSRIVSLNMCTDELVLRLAEPRRIASVTWLARDPGSANMAAEAAAIPVNHGLAEEVLAYKPDLVVAGAYTTRSTVLLLKRTGTRVVEFGVPNDLAGILAQIRQVADLLGETARGEALVAAMQARIAALPQPGPWRPAAFVLRPNGFTMGAGSLIDDILQAAGIRNLAAEHGLASYAQIPLESVILQEADMLIVDATPGGPPSLASEILQHPALRKLAGRVRIVPLPSRLWTCAGPEVLDAMEQLTQARLTQERRKAEPRT